MPDHLHQSVPSAEPLGSPDPGSNFSPAKQRERSSRQTVLWILAVLVFALPTLSLPNQGVWLGLKTFLLEAGGIVLALFVFSRGEWTRERVRHLLLAPQNLAIFAYLAWIGISVTRSPLPEYSRYEAMRHFGGALVYFGIVYGLSVRRQLPTLVSGICLAGTIGALLAFVTSSQETGPAIHGAFQNSQLLAAFLCVLLPVAVMDSQNNPEPMRRIGAQIATVVVAAGILVARNRSSWLGSAVAIVVLLALYFPFFVVRQRLRLHKHQVVIPLLMVVLAVGLFFRFSSQGVVLLQRAQTLQVLQADESYRWRRGMWDKARRMANEKPVFGWGVGTFPIQQALFFHPDVPTRTQFEIATTGPTLGENAHNTYWQMAVELGYVGLALYLLIFGTLFVCGVQYLVRSRPGYRSAILLAALAGLAAQLTTGFGNPAWEFPECSLMLWVLFALAALAMGLGERGRETLDSNPTVRKKRRRSARRENASPEAV